MPGKPWRFLWIQWGIQESFILTLALLWLVLTGIDVFKNGIEVSEFFSAIACLAIILSIFYLRKTERKKLRQDFGRERRMSDD